MSVPSFKKIFFTFLLAVALVAVLPVNAQVISEEWKDSIETYLRQVDTNTTAEIVVFVVDSLWGHGIQNEGSEIHEIVHLGVYIFNEMPLDTPNGMVVGIGKKGKDNGVLILVVIEEREWRIEVGYGLEGYITDIESSHIAQQYMVPKFAQEEYGQGLYDTVVALSQKIPSPSEPEDLPIRGRYFYENASVQEMPTWVVLLFIIVFGAVIVIFVVLAVLVKKGRIKIKRARTTGGGYSGPSGRRPSGEGRKGGGGRSGGGGSKGKW